MKIIGKVLWWDRKDLNGIIVDASGNEYYFDISVVEGKRTVSFKPGQILKFQINPAVEQISCAKNVQVPNLKSKKRLEDEFKRGLQLSLQF